PGRIVDGQRDLPARLVLEVIGNHVVRRILAGKVACPGAAAAPHAQQPNRCAGLAMTSALSWRKAEISSMAQAERPCVATSRSAPLIAMSRTCEVGRFNCSDCHCWPPLNDTMMPFAVPANSRFLFTGSCRTTYT